jgi:hypothetical protein
MLASIALFLDGVPMQPLRWHERSSSALWLVYSTLDRWLVTELRAEGNFWLIDVCAQHRGYWWFLLIRGPSLGHLLLLSIQLWVSGESPDTQSCLENAIGGRLRF